MKKFCFVAVAALMSIGMQAKEEPSSFEKHSATARPHSVAITLGSVEGVSYRYFVNEHVAVQTNLMWKYLSTYGTTVSRQTLDVMGKSQTSRTSQWGKLRGWTAEVNPNFIYQTTVRAWAWGSLYWNSGVGVGMGVAQDWRMPADYPLWGKFGINTISGLELSFCKYPISVFTESFAGYGLLWNNYEVHLFGATSLTRSCNHFIDWGSGIGIRFAFGK